MHELGVVFHIADQVMDVARENDVHHIARVVLQLGEVSTVIPYYLSDCWNWNARRYPLLENCQLDIEILPARTFCSECRSLYETVQYGKICPHCGSDKTWLKTGNELIIKEIEADA